MRSKTCKPHFAAVQNRIVRMNSRATSADCASVPTTSVEEIQIRSLQTPFRVASLGYLAAKLSTLFDTVLRDTVPPGGRHFANLVGPSEALVQRLREYVFFNGQNYGTPTLCLSIII